jgi:hypothetical protein
VDFDLVTSVTSPEELRSRLPVILGQTAIRPEPVWRRRDFARFEIGKLPDGREEWLEFRLRNHLLEDFATLKTRAEIGNYGGEPILFMGLADMMKSKETERESDWNDIGLLEEIQDDRNRIASQTAPIARISLLSALRSRRGMDHAMERGLMVDREVVTKAIVQCKYPVTCAFLYPYAMQHAQTGLLSHDFTSLLSSVPPGSAKHFAMVEIVRRDYKRKAMERDRMDKQRMLRDE